MYFTVDWCECSKSVLILTVDGDKFISIAAIGKTNRFDARRTNCPNEKTPAVARTFQYRRKIVPVVISASGADDLEPSVAFDEPRLVLEGSSFGMLRNAINVDREAAPAENRKQAR